MPSATADSPLRQVLLARPHNFIVEPMQSFVTGAGYQVVRIARFEQIAEANPAHVAGVVISAAIVADLPRTFVDVFREVRLRLPEARLAIAGLGTVATTVTLATGELGAEARKWVFVATEKDPNERLLGTLPAILVLRRDDVAKPELGKAAGEALRRHFR